MLLLVRSWRRLVATTAFTVAHSITLALATLGFVHVPPQPVEAAIALSTSTAAEIVHGRMGRTGLTERWPWVVAFVFGLLHGLDCERTARGRPAGERDPDRLAVLQSRGGAGPARLRRRVLALASLRSLQLSAPMEPAPAAYGTARWRCTGPLEREFVLVMTLDPSASATLLAAGRWTRSEENAVSAGAVAVHGVSDEMERRGCAPLICHCPPLARSRRIRPTSPKRRR